MMEPLKITFSLDTPFCATGYPLHLDALVAFAVTRRALAEGIEDQQQIDVLQPIRSLAQDLPFERYQGNPSGWVWKASALLPTHLGEQSIRMWTRKTNVDDYAYRAMKGAQENAGLALGNRTQKALLKRTPYAGAMNTSNGLLKNYFEFYPVVEVFEMQAWCIGDIDSLEMLLAPESGLITHLGKRGRIGHGHIASVSIVPCPEAVDLWKKRVLPWQESIDYIPIQAAFQPPYWAIENRKMAFIPKDI